MSGAVVTLRGIRVRVVTDEPDPIDEGCPSCVFKGALGGCPTAQEELAAGTTPCVDEGHYYAREEEDAQA